MARRRPTPDPYDPDNAPRVILLMADYSAFPLWRSGAMIGPEGLTLSPALVEALRRWADTYDSLASWAYEWPSLLMRDEFVAEGYRLWRRLQRELGPDWSVEYFHDVTGRIER